MSNESYTARHLQVLEGLEAVHKRPGMYAGSTDSYGFMHCLWEIIDNAVDEVLGGHMDAVEVRLYADGSVEVRDNGHGAPVDEVPGAGPSGVEVVYIKLHAGGKLGGGSYGPSDGLHGVGVSVVSTLSERMDVQTDRDGETYQIQFHRGEPGCFSGGASSPNPCVPFSAFTESSVFDVVGKVVKNRSGTWVCYWADPEIFLASAAFSYGELVERTRRTAFLVPGLTISLVGERESAAGENAAGENAEGEDDEGQAPHEGPRTEIFRFDGGTVDFVDFLAPDAAVTATMRLTGEGTFVEKVPVLDAESDYLVSREVERAVAVDIASRQGKDYKTRVESFINIIRTPGGGTHQSGFEQGLMKIVRSLVESNSRRLKMSTKDPRIEKDDALVDLTAVVTVRLPEPQFEGQTKEILGTSAVRGAVSGVIERELGAILGSSKRDQKTETSRLLEKVVAEMRARVTACMHKEIFRCKNVLEALSLPAKLANCRSEDVAETELLIVEGDSALGAVKLMRSSEFQAPPSIRGKILSVQKVSTTDILKNKEVSGIIQVIETGSGRAFDLPAARYGKVIMMTDADADGAHIHTLLLTLFLRYMRPFVQEGRVYTTVPPLHRIEAFDDKGGKKSYIYAYSEDQLHAEFRKLERVDKSYREPTQRYKGFGEMDAHQPVETAMDLSCRTLRRIRMEDGRALMEAETVFELLMGNDVAPRREFTVEGVATADRDRIDA